MTIYNIALLLAANGALVASGANAALATLVKSVTLNIGCLVSSVSSILLFQYQYQCTSFARIQLHQHSHPCEASLLLHVLAVVGLHAVAAEVATHYDYEQRTLMHTVPLYCTEHYLNYMHAHATGGHQLAVHTEVAADTG